MLPVLAHVTIGGADVAIRAYSTLLLLAAIGASCLFVHAAARLGARRRDSAAAVLLAIAAGLAGARALDAALNPRAYAADPSLVWAIAARGFAVYGGLAAGAAVLLAMAPRLGVGRAQLADASVPAVAVGIALVRVGCFLNGCCSGIESGLPWAVRFPVGGSAWTGQVLGGSTAGLFGTVHPVHPTQLYELAGVLASCALATALNRRRPLPPGSRALLFTALFLAVRVAVLLLRPVPPGLLIPPAGIAAASAVLALGAVVLLAARAGAPARNPGLPA